MISRIQTLGLLLLALFLAVFKAGYRPEPWVGMLQRARAIEVDTLVADLGLVTKAHRELNVQCDQETKRDLQQLDAEIRQRVADWTVTADIRWVPDARARLDVLIRKTNLAVAQVYGRQLRFYGVR